MGLVTAILGLPLAPVRMVVSLGEVIERQVERETRDPASARRDLERIERARESGEISAEEEAEAQQRVLDRMTRKDTRPANPKEG
ncbi:MAG TPA: gas vesicle protein GvpG [Amycolatopsis sp.]|jgi:hypothetical protein|nr:gas vesicle protein GvpG [Amycolatopsis sp.]